MTNKKIQKIDIIEILLSSQGRVASRLVVASATPTWPPPRPEASVLPSSPASPVGEPNLDGVLRSALVNPPRPRSLEPLFLTSRPKAVLHSLSLLVRGLLRLPADQISNPPISRRQGMHRVRPPQLEAGLILAGHLNTRIEDGHVLESACKKEILVKSTTLCETLPHPLFDALLSYVRSVIESRTAGLVQVARQRRQEEHYQLLQELEDVDAVFEIHIQSLLACQD
jgi:hypothetical protein